MPNANTLMTELNPCPMSCLKTQLYISEWFRKNFTSREAGVFQTLWTEKLLNEHSVYNQRLEAVNCKTILTKGR